MTDTPRPNTPDDSFHTTPAIHCVDCCELICDHDWSCQCGCLAELKKDKDGEFLCEMCGDKQTDQLADADDADDADDDDDKTSVGSIGPIHCGNCEVLICNCEKECKCLETLSFDCHSNLLCTKCGKKD